MLLMFKRKLPKTQIAPTPIATNPKIKEAIENSKSFSDILWCEDCKYFTRYDMGGEGFCDVDDSSTWYGRPICERFERKYNEN